MSDWLLRKLKLTGAVAIAPQTRDDLTNTYRGIIARTEQELESRGEGGHESGWSVLVTASGLGEGVSTVASNLAFCLAQTRSVKVVLVESVMPRLDPPYRVEREVGLVDFLKERADYSEIIQPVLKDELFVIPYGTESELPPLEYAVAPLIARLRKEFAFIIVDGPRASTEADVKPWLSCLDGTIMVIEANRTRRETLECTKFLNEAQAPLLGVVLNKREYFVPDWLYARV